MTPDAPHTADLVDEVPDERRAPRGLPGEVRELHPQSGSGCPSGASRPPGDTPDPAARGLYRVASLWRFLRDEADMLDECIRAAQEGEVVTSRLSGVAVRLRARADDLAT